MNPLFEAANAGGIQVRNRIVMAPMTRARATEGANLSDFHTQYYAQRASAGLILTEGVAPSPDGLGYARTPGIFSDAQREGWRSVTEAVHRNGGAIATQLMHVGRIGHPLNQPAGARLVAPSAIAARGTMWTDVAGAKAYPTPAELTVADIRKVIDDFVLAVRNAREAGFDGVELHAANGYLLNQFLSPNTNQRSDEYGGSPERRTHFLLELFDAVAAAWSPDRIGVRFSPGGTFNDILDHEAGLTYPFAAKELSQRGAGFLHVVRPAPFAPAEAEFNVWQVLREHFRGTLIVNGGITPEEGETLIRSGAADLIAVGRPFIANPDYPARVRNGWALSTPEPKTFDTPGPAGYIDYPAYTAELASV